jgi:probable LLM family oxidoreductase
MELGIYSFVETPPGPPETLAGRTNARLAQMMEEAELADELGLDVFGLGEHHRPDFLISAPPIALAAIAARTKRIRLTSAVTVLSSDDPVRVYQQFATLDQLSNGRAEIMAGRGSFIESFPLFGYPLDQYDELFAEKLDLLLAIRANEHVTWSGTLRSSLKGQGIYPRALQNPLPVWIAVGGTPQSVARAGYLGLPLVIAIIGGQPERFAPLAKLYREAASQAGHDLATLQLGIGGHGFVADTSDAAADAFLPSLTESMNRIGKERGWGISTRDHFEAGRDKRGHLLLGSPDEVIEKILFQHTIFQNTRYAVQMTVGPVDHDKVLRSIELFATKVAPAVRAEVASRNKA